MTVLIKSKLTVEPKLKSMKKKTRQGIENMGHLSLKMQMKDGRERRKEIVAYLNKSKMTKDKKDGCMAKSKRRMTRFS